MKMRNHYSAKTAMLSNIVDYAGTFPPASSTLDEAMRQAATFRRTAKHPWIMGRLTLKWSDIKTLTPRRLFGCGADGGPWVFSALGNEVTEPGDWERQQEWDLREIRNYNARYSGTSAKIWVVGYEAKIPTLPQNEMPVRIAAYLDSFWEATNGDQALYLEVPFGDDFNARLTAVIESIGRWMEDKNVSKWTPGLKFRTAGAYTPKPSELAVAISQTTYARFQFKATQGLHEAVTHGGSFGFVNLFAALNLSQALGSDAFGMSTIESCLIDEKAGNFEFKADSFRWKDHTLSSDEIETARRFHAATFGSCSVAEPDESLAKTFPDA